MVKALSLRMQITVIIPVLNEALHIGSLLRYLQKHGHGALNDILVVDGGSTDNTVRIATESGAKVLHCSTASRAAQMNMGARAAQGDILYFVHADTLPPDTYVADIHSAIESGYKMGCYRYRFDSMRFLLKVNAFFNRFNWLWCQGGDKTYFIRREIFFQLGCYDEYYTIMEEYDFLRRAMQKNYPLRIIPKYAIASARKYETNGWFRVQYANATLYRMFRKGATPADMKRVYKGLLRL